MIKISHTRWTRIGFAAAVISVTATSATAQPAINSMLYLEQYQPGQSVSMYRGVAGTVRVSGRNLESTVGASLAVKREDGTVATGLSASLAGVSGSGMTSSIDIRVASNVAAVAGTYQVTFSCLIGGPQSFKVLLNERGSVTGIITDQGREGAIAVAINTPVTLIATGPGVEQAHIFAGPGTNGVVQLGDSAELAYLSTSPNSLRFRVTMKKPVLLNIKASAFFDGPVPFGSCAPSCGYTGDTRFIVVGNLENTITAVNPKVVDPDGTITLSGHNLAAPHYTSELQYRTRYAPFVWKTRAVTLSPTFITFTAPSDAGTVPMRVTFVHVGVTEVGLQNPMVPLPTPVYVRVPPTVTRTDTTTDAGMSVIRQDSVRIRGRDLLSAADVFAPGTPGVVRTATAVTYAGQPLAVMRVTRLADEDELVVQGPAASALSSGALVVTTTGGTVSKFVQFVPRPAVTAIQEIAPSGARVTLAPGAILHAGGHFVAIGSSLVTVVGGSVLKTAVTVGGPQGSATVTVDPSRPGELPFTFSGGANASGPLVLTTVGGAANAGDYTVRAAAPAPALLSASVAPNPLVGGMTATATLAFAGAITPGADTTFVDITPQSLPDRDAVPARSRVAVTSNPFALPLPTLPVATPRSVTLVVSPSAGSAPAGTPVQATVVLQPLQVVSLGLSAKETSGGRPIQARATFNGAVTSSGAELSVLSSNAAIAAVPSSVAVSGQTVTFTVTTSVVNVPTPVNITVSLGGATQTATLYVTPPRVASINPAAANVRSFDSTVVTLTLDADPLGADTVTIAASDASALAVPSRLLMTTRSAQFVARANLVGVQKVVTLTATSGGATTSVPITVKPLGLTMALSSPIATAGTSATATVILSPAVQLPAGLQFTREITSSDTAVVKNQSLQSGASFSPGQTVVAFPVPTVAPQAQARTVTITYKLLFIGAQNAAASALLPSASATLTVNP